MGKPRAMRPRHSPMVYLCSWYPTNRYSNEHGDNIYREHAPVKYTIRRGWYNNVYLSFSKPSSSIYNRKNKR